MAGIVHDHRNASVATPGDGRGDELGKIIDRAQNGYFENVYVYTLNAAGTAVRSDIRAYAYGISRYSVSATTTHTTTNAVITVTGASTTQTIPAPANDGDRILVLNKNAGSNAVTAGANAIFDDGIVDLNNNTNGTPTARTTATLKGIGAFIELTGVNGKWVTTSGTTDRTGSDAIALTFS